MVKVKSVSETMQIIDSMFQEIDVETEVVHIDDSPGRICAEDVFSGEDVPGFNRSSVDGYGVISKDTFGASDSMPAQLKYCGEVIMGEMPDKEIHENECCYVPTGGYIPERADAVVMIEDAEDYNDGYIYVNKPAAPGANIVYKGDDIKYGELAIRKGTVLQPQHIGVACALGIEYVKVKRKLRAGIISTGDELVSSFDINNAKGAKIRDINSHTIYAGVARKGWQAVQYGIVRDNYEEIANIVGKALDECDIVLVSGGSSVGTRDLTAKVINDLGEPGVLIHGIAVKPGKPTIIGKAGGKAIVGLPGHPASAFMIFNHFVTKLMDKLCGIDKIAVPSLKARLISNYPSNAGREEFVPVKLTLEGAQITATPLFGKSAMIKILGCSDGYFVIPRDCEGFSKDEYVEVYTW